MARENLRYAADTVATLKAEKPDILQALIRKTGLEPKEAETWARAADKMYVPFDAATGIYPRDDGFLDRQPRDFENAPDDRYPSCCSTIP
jgi:alpha,alpha-trehalose phosphorylase